MSVFTEVGIISDICKKKKNNNERESYSLDVNIPILDSDSRNYDDDNHLIVEAISCLFS